MTHSNRKRASCGLDIANPTDLEVCITVGVLIYEAGFVKRLFKFVEPGSFSMLE